MSVRRHFLTLLAPLCALALAAPAARAQTGTITTIAGGGPNNLPALSANLNYDTSGLAMDKNGNLYLASESDNRVYEIDAAGTLTIFAGIGERGYGGDNGPATSALLSSPVGVCVDSSGNVFIADTGNTVIRRVDAVTHTITTVAGTGVSGTAGNGGPATSAELSDPFGVYVDVSGNIFIADLFPNVIQEVVAATGNIQIVAGGGTQTGNGIPATSAAIGEPWGIYGDVSGNIFFADETNSIIREVYCTNPGVSCTPPMGFVANDINTVAGNGTNGYSGDGGPATSAQLYFPQGVFVDGSENIFIADTDNSVIREVVAATGKIQTVAGNGTSGFSGDGGSAVSAELAYPFTMIVDGTGDIYIADVGNFRIREVIAATGDIQTFAGNGFSQYSGDGYPATDGALDQPAGVTSDGNGNLYIGDSENDVVRKVDATTGDISTIAGSATLGCGYSGDGGPATSASLCRPQGVFVDSFGNLFIADYDNYVVREVLSATGDIQTVAGNGTYGSTGDGVPATSAMLAGPVGVFVDSSGNLFIADTYNNVIREVYCTNTGVPCTPPTGYVANDIHTVAGGGEGCDNSSPIGDGCPATSAQLSQPYSVFVDRSGNIFIADTGNAVVREVFASSGTIQTVAGTPEVFGYSGDGGPATSAQTSGPDGVVVDAVGNIFFTDCGGFTEEEECNNAVREVVGSSGFIQTVAGNGMYGFSGDGGPATSAELDNPLGIGFDPAGDVLIPDYSNNRVRSVAGLATVIVASVAPATVPFGSVPENTTGTPMTVTLTNNGIFPLNFTSAPSISVVSGNPDFSITGGTCAVATPVAPYGGTCTVTVSYTPTVAGSETSTLTFADDAMPATQTVSLSGTGTQPVVGALASEAFGTVPIGTPSGTVTVTVTNTGTAPLNFTSITVTGTSPANNTDFTITGGSCMVGTAAAPSPVAPGGNCTINLAFKPTAMPAAGMTTVAETATLNLADNAPGSPQTAMLTGTGTLPVVTFNPTAAVGLNLGAIAPGAMNSVTETLTVAAGTGNLQISFIQVINPEGTNAFAITGGTCPTDGGTVPAGSNCTVVVQFTAPQTTGTYNGTLEFVGTNLVGSPVNIPLTGTSSTGPPLTLTAVGQNGANGTTITLLPGDTGTYTIIVQPGPQFTGTVTISCQEVTAIPATILTASPAMITVTTAPSGPITVRCTLQTNCNTSLVGPKPPSSAPPWTVPPVGAVLLLAMLLAMRWRGRGPGGGRGWARQMAPACAMVLLVLLVMTWAACVNNPAPAIPNAPTTPAGVYQIQVVATVSATGQVVTLPLTVHII